MARTAVTPVVASRNAATIFVNDATTTDGRKAIDSTLVSTGVKIKYNHNDHLLIHIVNTTTTALDVTIQASADEQAYMKGQGDMVVEVPAKSTNNAEVIFMGLEQPRFCNKETADQYLYIDFETGFEGFIWAIETLNA